MVRLRSRRLRRGLHGPAPHGRARHVAGGVRENLASRVGSVISRSLKDTRTLLRSLAASKQEPHGGKLVNLFTEDIESEVASCSMELQLTDRQSRRRAALQRRFSPLEGFMDEATYGSVVNSMELPSGLMFSARRLRHGRGPSPPRQDPPEAGQLAVATMEVTPVRAGQAPRVQELLRHVEPRAPAQMVAMERGKYYLGGKLAGLNKPARFPRRDATEVRERLPDGVDIVAFQCRNPVHRAHYELFTR
ncbi:sulfate adenylyltransferase [Aureococcus anophagefferens]|nr:sulfate adenylyltransferase [Aureococcus anophagefferens]